MKNASTLKLSSKAKVVPLFPDFKPYLIALALLAGLFMANELGVIIWRMATCNC